MTAVPEGGEWSAASPGRTLPPGKTRYPLYMRLSGPQGRSGRAENLVPTGIRSRTVQPVAQSLYRLSYSAHSPNVIWVIKSRSMRWGSHVTRMGNKRSVHRILVGTSDGKRPLGRRRRSWEDNIKIDIQEVGWGSMD